MKNKIEEFRKCLGEKRYYDAHESLEEAWFPRRFEDDDEVRLLKGFINASVSFELHKRGKIKQSKKVWLNYLKYRQLLFKVQTQELNEYYQLSLYIEKIKKDMK
jgi:hypothetical protein